MATITGNNGKIMIGGTNSSGVNTSGKQVLAVKSYTVDIKSDTIETTVMSNDVRTYLKGMSSWSGSADVYFETTTLSDIPGLIVTGGTVGSAATTAIFYLDSIAYSAAKAFDGSIIITGFSIKSSMDGMVEATISFQGSGALTYTA